MKRYRSYQSLALAMLLLLIGPGCGKQHDPVAPQPQGLRIARSGEELIQLLAVAYRTQDEELLESLLANDADLPGYTFVTPPQAGLPPESWGLAEEMRLHRRMFRPEVTSQDPTPVPEQIWVTSISITLTQETHFTERSDLYVSEQNPDGLSPTRWKVGDAIYGADILFDLQGDIDYQVNTRVLFVVVDDLHKQVGESRKFLILQCRELAPTRKPLVSPRGWYLIKMLYR